MPSNSGRDQALPSLLDRSEIHGSHRPRLPTVSDEHEGCWSMANKMVTATAAIRLHHLSPPGKR